MKATGIVRKVDELGRIVIPREIRQALNIKKYQPLEMVVIGGLIVIGKVEEREGE